MKMSNRIFKAAITLFAMSAMLFSWSLWPSVQGASPKSQVQKAQTLTQSKRDEAQKAIQKGILGRIASSANNSLRKFPSPSQLRNVNTERRNYLEQVRKLLEEGKSASKWNADQLGSFADRVASLKDKAVHLDNSGGGGGKTCVTSCKDEYNKCLEENDCEYSFICICCVPCSLQYMGCIAGCIGVGGGGGVIRQ